jgi:endonuclease YncB( thermonuclease family)
MSHPPLGITARASVIRVIDGDTIEVAVHWPLVIRLKDCWAPEVRGPESPQGKKSKSHLENLLAPGDAIVFNIESKAADSLGDVLSFGRVIGQVWRPGEDSSVSDLMIDAGFASRTK